jgi:hypothetical protein
MFKKSLVALLALATSVGAFASTAASAAAASAPAVAASAAVAAEGPGFFAAMFLFFGGLLLTWPALLGLVVLGIIFEHNEARVWTVLTVIALAAVAYFFFSFSLMHIAYGAVAYIAIGLVWSWYRYGRHADTVVEKFKDALDSEKKRALELLHPTAMLSTITSWIMAWPFSFVENVIGDLINAIQSLVTKFFRGVYHRIFNNAAAKLGVK